MSANPERGEVDITIGETTYTLKLSMNAACVLESRLKKRIGEILADAASLDFTAIRDLVWLLLQKHHGAEFRTDNRVDALMKVGNLIDEAGGVKMFFETLRQLGAINQPTEAGGSGSDPRDAQSGRGDGSTSSPSVAA